MSDPIPLLFTLPPGSRHEIILFPTTTPTLKALNAQITSTLNTSPNCAEFMAKYKKSSAGDGAEAGAAKEQINEIKVLWDRKGRDTAIWPESTVVTEGNFAAVLELMRRAPGRDVLAVKVGKGE